MTVNVHIPTRRVVGLLAVLAVLNVAFLVTTGLRYSARESGGRGLWTGPIGQLLDLGAERNLAAWYSAVILLGVAAVWFGCFILDLGGARSARERIVTGGWLMLAALFTALSLDEEGSFHERIGGVSGHGQFGVIMTVLVVLGLCMAVFAWLRLRRSGLGLGLVFMGFLCYVSVPIQERIVVALQAAGTYAGSWHTGARDVVLEEGTELLASFFFLTAALVYARALGRSLKPTRPETWLSFTSALSPRASSRSVTVAVVLLGAAFLWVQFVVLAVVASDSQFKPGQLGSPPDWFAAVIALLTGVACLALAAFARGGPETSQRRRLWSALGAFALLVSTHHGAGHVLTDLLWAGSPRRALATNVGLGLVAVALAAWGVRELNSLRGRLLILGWGVVLAAAFLQREPLASLLAFAAYAMLLGALTPTAAELDLGPMEAGAVTSQGTHSKARSSAGR